MPDRDFGSPRLTAPTAPRQANRTSSTDQSWICRYSENEVQQVKDSKGIMDRTSDAINTKSVRRGSGNYMVCRDGKLYLKAGGCSGANGGHQDGAASNNFYAYHPYGVVRTVGHLTTL